MASLPVPMLFRVHELQKELVAKMQAVSDIRSLELIDALNRVIGVESDSSKGMDASIPQMRVDSINRELDLIYAMNPVTGAHPPSRADIPAFSVDDFVSPTALISSLSLI